MAGTRKIAAILVADVVGYSRLAGADEDRTLSRLRGLRSDLIDPAIDAHHGRIVKRTGDGILIEFRSVVDVVRCAIEVQQWPHRAQRRPAARTPHRISCRNSFGRCRRRGRRRSDGRRRQHRRAIGKHLRAGQRSVCPRTPIGRSKGGSISPSPISARPNSRTSPSRSGSIRLKSASQPRRSRRRRSSRPHRKSVRRRRRSLWGSPRCSS